METIIEKADIITSASRGIGRFPANKKSGQRFAMALQYAAGAVLGVLLDIGFMLFVLWGTDATLRGSSGQSEAYKPGKNCVFGETAERYKGQDYSARH